MIFPPFRSIWRDIILFIGLFIPTLLALNAFKPQYVPFKIALIADSPVENASAHFLQWDAGYGYNETQKFRFGTNKLYTKVVSNFQTLQTNIFEIKGASREDFTYISGIQTNLQVEYTKKIPSIVLYPNTNKEALDLNITLNGTSLFIFSLKSGELMSLSESPLGLSLSVSSAVMDGGFHGYTKSWRAETSTEGYTASLIAFANGYAPLKISGLGAGRIEFKPFTEPFTEPFNISNFSVSRTLAWITASLIWALMIFTLLKFLFSSNFRKYFVSLKTLHLFLFYFFSLWLLFILFGIYWIEVSYWANDFLLRGYSYTWESPIFSHFMPYLGHYLAGVGGFSFQLILPCSLISTLIYKLLRQLSSRLFLCLFIPLALWFLPGFHLAFFSALWRGSVGGLWWLLSGMVTFHFIYFLPRYKIIGAFLSLSCAYMAILYRSDFFPLPIVLGTFWIFRIVPLLKWKVVALVALLFVSGLILRQESRGESNRRTTTLLSQYAWAYAHPKFYHETNFTAMEKSNLRFYEPFQREGDALTVFEAAHKYYSFADAHRFNLANIDYRPFILRKLKENPWPMIYARLRTLGVSLIPSQRWGSDWWAGRVHAPLNSPLNYPLAVVSNTPYRAFLNNFNLLGTPMYQYMIIYGAGPLMVLLMTLSLIFWKKAPITSLINLSCFFYLGVLLLINIAAGGFYYYGGYLSAIVSPLLFYLELKFRAEEPCKVDAPQKKLV